jgi:predicted O-methyltransferase YrrM
MAFVDRDLEYLDAVHPPAGAVLKAMQAQGRAEKIPIVNAATGWLLRIQVAAVQPNRVVEVGTAIGFSTLWMATALPAGGRILTIDPDRSRTTRAQAFWRQAGVEERIEVINEPALTALPRLEAGIGFAFIDALKTEYLGYLDLLVPRMALGGMIAADNLLWSGRIAAGDTDPDTAALRAFNQRFLHHERLDATILPVGDGVGIGVVRRNATVK